MCVNGSKYNGITTTNDSKNLLLLITLRGTSCVILKFGDSSKKQPGYESRIIKNYQKRRKDVRGEGVIRIVHQIKRGDDDELEEMAIVDLPYFTVESSMNITRLQFNVTADLDETMKKQLSSATNKAAHRGEICKESLRSDRIGHERS